jgi:hypothetical protein
MHGVAWHDMVRHAWMLLLHQQKIVVPDVLGVGTLELQDKSSKK